MFVIHKKHIIFVSLLLAVLLCGCVLLTALSTSAVSTNGMTIVLDAGHGGIDGGVTGVNSKVKESEINLSIVRLLETQLAGAGFKVVLTRKSEGGLYAPTDKNKKKSDMKKRKEIIEAAEPVAVVSVHQNKFPLSSRKGGQVFFRNDSARRIYSGRIQRALGRRAFGAERRLLYPQLHRLSLRHRGMRFFVQSRRGRASKHAGIPKKGSVRPL